MDLIDKQIKAYNEQKIDEFIDCYSDDIQVYMLETNQKLTDGKNQLKETMKTSFKSKPDAETIVESRIIQYNLVIDIEAISGYQQGKIIRTIAIYEVKDNKITKLWFGGRSIEDTIE